MIRFQSTKDERRPDLSGKDYAPALTPSEILNARQPDIEASVNMPKLRDRLRQIMKRRNLTRRELANGLGTSRFTLNSWLDQGCTPPASLAPLLTLIEEKPQARSRLGLRRGRKLPRGRPFQPGNRWRLNDPRRPEALAEARARKQAVEPTTKGK